jgi:hypothetical protein
MGTSLTEIADLFLSAVSDYRLNAIYATSGSVGLNNQIEPFLLKSIEDFTLCDQALVYTSTSGSVDGYFSVTLTMTNQIMLSMHMELYWLQKSIQDVRALSNFIQDRDFKGWSPAQMLTARTAHYNAKKEELSQRLVDYSYNRTNWSDWKLQNFDSS